jgi:hypothetical protein
MLGLPVWSWQRGAAAGTQCGEVDGLQQCSDSARRVLFGGEPSWDRNEMANTLLHALHVLWVWMQAPAGCSLLVTFQGSPTASMNWGVLAALWAHAVPSQQASAHFGTSSLFICLHHTYSVVRAQHRRRCDSVAADRGLTCCAAAAAAAAASADTSCAHTNVFRRMSCSFQMAYKH